MRRLNTENLRVIYEEDFPRTFPDISETTDPDRDRDTLQQPDPAFENTPLPEP